MPALKNLEDGSVSIEGDAQGVSLGELEGHAGFLLRIAQLAVFERFFENLGQSEVRLTEITVLVAIAENPGIRQGVLADVLKIKWSNMTKLVRTLEARELIIRHIPPHDRRSVELHVTGAGRAQIDAVQTRMGECDREAVAMLSDEEHAQLLRLARKVAGWPPMPAGGTTK